MSDLYDQAKGNIHFLPIYESQERVNPEDGPEYVSRFRWRAERYRRRLDRYRTVPFYRLEVVRENGRWAVVAFQNLPWKPDG